MASLSNVAVVCGTHGNEFTGIYLHKQWQKNPELLQREGLNVRSVFAHPEAFQANKRYLESDLNRQFKTSDLNDPELTNLEQRLAKKLNQQLGPKGNAKTDFVIDLHNTTSNMGPCLLLTQQGDIYNKLAGYISLRMPEVKITRDEDHLPAEDHHLLCTLGTFGVIVEVGPVNQSVLDHKVYRQAEQMTAHILDFISLYKLKKLPPLPKKVTAYRYLDVMMLPVNDEGERLGMVHESLDRNDFKPLNPGEPLFHLFSGETVYYEGDRTVYPNFINEAAYYDNNLALSLAEKVEIDVYAEE